MEMTIKRHIPCIFGSREGGVPPWIPSGIRGVETQLADGLSCVEQTSRPPLACGLAITHLYGAAAFKTPAG